MNISLTRVEAYKDTIQEAIEQGTTTVEQIHKRIVDVPLALLDKNGLVKLDEEKRNALWEQSIGQVYDVIRRINTELGALANKAFEAIEDQITTQKNISKAEGSDAVEAAVDSKPQDVTDKARVHSA